MSLNDGRDGVELEDATPDPEEIPNTISVEVRASGPLRTEVGPESRPGTLAAESATESESFSFVGAEVLLGMWCDMMRDRIKQV